MQCLVMKNHLFILHLDQNTNQQLQLITNNLIKAIIRDMLLKIITHLHRLKTMINMNHLKHNVLMKRNMTIV
jgi:hypothetical protein